MEWDWGGEGEGFGGFGGAAPWRDVGVLRFGVGAGKGGGG